MTQEEKVRAYDKALSVALETYKTQPTYRDWLEKMFPELKESENEMVRKALINGFNKLDKSAVWYNGITNAQILDWLEKQVNHANFRNKIEVGDKVTRNRDGYLVNLSQLNRVAKVEEKQEQKPQGKSALEAAQEEKVDNQNCVKSTSKVKLKFKVGDEVIGIISGTQYYITEVCDNYYCTESGCIIMFAAQDNFELVEQQLKKIEQKPTDEEIKELLRTEYEKGRADAISEMQNSWNEEDEKFVHGLIRGLSAKRDIHGHTTFSSDGIDITKTINWLKSLKDRVQPKQEWSEEDEEHIKSLLERLEGMCKKGATFIRTMFAVSEDEDWLKSFKDRMQPQPQWKPSDEQIIALRWVLNNIPYNKHKEEISGLLDQIKEL